MPVNRVVRVDITLAGRRPQLVDSGARRQVRRHSRQSDEAHVVQGRPDRDVSRPVRRVLRRLPRGDARERGRRRRRASTSRYLASRRQPARARRPGVARRLREVSRARRVRAATAPQIANNSILVQPRGPADADPHGLNQRAPVANYMPPVARGWTDAQVKALLAYLKAARLQGGAEWRLEPSRSPRTAPDWRRGRVASWVTTVDHKRIGILYIVHVARLLRRRRDPRAADARAARDARTSTSSRATPTTSSSRSTARR